MSVRSELGFVRLRPVCCKIACIVKKIPTFLQKKPVLLFKYNTKLSGSSDSTLAVDYTCVKSANIVSIIMAALRSRCGHYIFPCGFFFLLLLFSLA